MNRVIKWTLGLLLVAVAGLFLWGYAPDTDPAAMRAKYASAASRFIEVESGLKVHVRDEGKRDGPVLVLVHGSSSSLHTWEPWVKRLGDRYRIISFDQSGHGLTGPHPRHDYSATGYVKTLDTLMTKLGVAGFTLAGNSMGGWVAWNYALAHPDRVSALALIDASGAPDATPTALPIGFRLANMPALRPVMRVITPRSVIATSVHQTMSKREPINDAMIDRYWELIRYPGNREATGLRSAVKRVASDPDQMKGLTMPTLIMWGAEDQLIPVASASWFAAAIPGAKTVIYPGVGHIPMEEIPDQSASDLAAFLGASFKTP